MGPPQVAFCLTLAAILAACAFNERSAAPGATRVETITADEALAISSRVVDCEWKAAYRFDDGRTPITELAERTMGVCIVERTKAKLAFGLSPNDPDLEADDFKQAVGIIESVRKAGRSKL
jgi:hypothetical protein